MKKPKKNPPIRKAVRQLVAALARFGKMPLPAQTRMLEDIAAGRESEETLQEVRNAIAEAIDECEGDGKLDPKYVLWG